MLVLRSGIGCLACLRRGSCRIVRSRGGALRLRSSRILRRRGGAGLSGALCH